MMVVTSSNCIYNYGSVMIGYWCGFNGFNQISRENDTCISQFRRIPLNIVKDFDFTWSCALMLSEGEVYVSGFCGGQCNFFTKLIKPDDVLEFSKVACNETYALFISEDGACWQYFYDTAEWKKLSNFTAVEKGHDVSSNDGKSLLPMAKSTKTIVDEGRNKTIKICCGEIVNIALDSLGQAYTIPSPIPLPGIKIKDVTCGFEHCLMLDELGRVYSLGSGMRGQLGHEILETRDSPIEIEALSGLHVVRIAAGGWHCAAVTSCGILYTWGWNNCGQLGFLCAESSATSTLSECIKGETNELPSSEHSITQNKLLRVNEDQVQNKGTKEYSQQSLEESQTIDVNIQTNKRMKCSHEEENLLNYDSKSSEMQAHNMETDEMCSKDLSECNADAAVEKKEYVSVQAVPKAVNFSSEIDIVGISCGNRHTVALAENGSVWGCGWNAYGQLGKSPETFVSVDSMISLDIPTDKTIRSVYCGGWNTVLVYDP